MIKFLFMNLIAGISSYLVVYKLFRFKNFVDSLVCWFIVYFAQVIFSQLVLGIFGLLYLKNVILLNLLIFLIAVFIVKNRVSSFDSNALRNFLQEILQQKIVLFTFSLISGFLIVKLFFNLINPPFGWDSLNYHYTFPVEWIKSANLNNPLVVSDDPFPSYYPLNGSLFFLWLMFPFKSAFLADLGQFLFFVISFLGIFSICRKLKINKEYSFLCACLFIIIPNFFKQLQIGYVDIMVGGMFIAALNFLLALKEDFNLKNAFIFALALGIFAGIKTTCLPYSIFLLLPFLYLLFYANKFSLLRRVVSLFLLISIVLVFGGFSYLRNLILTGNPFYPLEVMLLGNPVFKGVIDKATFIARREEGGDSLSKLLFHEGLGIQSILIILPATLFSFLVNFFKNKDKDILRNYLMLLPLFLYLAYRYILPLPNSRYLYPMLAAGICAGFYVLDSLKVPLKIIKIITAVFVLASVFDCAKRIELGISFAASFIVFLVFKKPRSFLFSKRAILCAIIISFVTLRFLFADYQKNEYIRYIKNSRYWPDATKAWAWLNENTYGDNIAYVGRPVPFPLYGTNFKNNVYYVSINSQDPIHLHDLKHSKYRWNSAENMHKNFQEPGNYRENADYALWLTNLNRRKTEFIFIYSLHHTKKTQFPLEETWAKENPDKFKLVFINETVKIYKLN